jgi:hypothetical protein
MLKKKKKEGGVGGLINNGVILITGARLWAWLYPGTELFFLIEHNAVG